MDRYVYINGDYVPSAEATISVFDHGLLYGDGVFEGIRAYNGLIFKLEEHVDRLYESAKALMLNVPLGRQDMLTAIVDTCRRNSLTTCYIRVIVTRGRGDLGLSPGKCADPCLIIIADQVQLYPEELYEQGMKVVTVPTRRVAEAALSPRIKSLNYLNNVLAKLEAEHLGYPEVLMQNADGHICEGTGDNLFVVKSGRLLTPARHSGILVGITRGVIMKLAEDCGYTVVETTLTRFDLYVADEIFLTGTAAEVVSVVEVDGRQVGSGVPGAVTCELRQQFRDLVMREGTAI